MKQFQVRIDVALDVYGNPTHSVFTVTSSLDSHLRLPRKCILSQTIYRSTTWMDPGRALRAIVEEMTNCARKGSVIFPPTSLAHLISALWNSRDHYIWGNVSDTAEHRCTLKFSLPVLCGRRK